MKYDLFCEITFENLEWLKICGYNPDISIYPGYFYIASYLEPQYLTMALMQLDGHISGLKTKEKRVSAKEMDYLYTLRNVQYRLGRFTDEVKGILKK